MILLEIYGNFLHPLSWGRTTRKKVNEMIYYIKAFFKSLLTLLCIGDVAKEAIELNLFLWGHLKSKVYATPSDILEELRERILNECGQMSPEILRRVLQRFEPNRFY